MTWLHRFATFVAAVTFVLILAGGLVTTTGAGLAVRDWPTTQGHSVLAFPWTGWVGLVAYQQAHRLAALATGALAAVLTAWIWRAERRRWVKGVAAFGCSAIVLQAIVGGMTVLLRLPALVSTLHAALANLFFATTTTLALVTSAGWLSGYLRGARPASAGGEPDPEVASANAVARDRLLRRLAIWTAVAVYVEILLGAGMRHAGAGLAIPDYPLAFGRLVPPADRMTAGVALHFLHRFWALVATLSVVLTAARIWAAHPSRHELVRPSAAVVALVIGEIALGGVAMLAGRNTGIEISLIGVGALILAGTVVIALRSYRPLLADDVGWAAERDRLGAPLAVGRPSSASAASAASLDRGARRVPGVRRGRLGDRLAEDRLG
jgi:cytochrome c oxidase assembly protein subunit 15